MDRLFHLTTIRKRRVLTPIGWAVLLIGFSSVLISIMLFVHPFLAPTKPVGGDILVVEGWLPDYALEKAKERFQQGGYQLLVTTGGKIGNGLHLSEYKTW
ncbi:MAG: YdcF family protein, partial [Nitrospina sp.]|nr:YdcF family protein [Nitrospina sp.]